MNRKERSKLVVLSRVKDKQLSRRQAAEALGLSLRQVHRVYRRYLAEGERGLVHRSRGRASSRRREAQEREKALSLYRELYRGFGPTLLAEKLGPGHGIWVSHDTARRWLIAEGLLEKTRRGRRSRRRRLRKERFGQMLQMDGSHHDWFEDRGGRCCLMVIVDDATGRMDGRFFEAETLSAALETLGRWCSAHGVPQSLYVDRHGIYREADREPTNEELQAGRRPLTQFARAMKELNVRLILARSPQAKGRVERANGTLQDRLVKELRLAKVGSVASANAWLEQSGFFGELGARFAVKPVDPSDGHRPLVMNLSDVLCVKEKRSVSLDGCVQWRGRALQLLGHRPGLRQVEVWEQTDGAVRLLDGGNRLSWQPAPAKPRPPRKPVVNNKKWKPGARSQLRLPGSRPPRPPVTFSLRPTG